jgi:hypothetical protein
MAKFGRGKGLAEEVALPFHTVPRPEECELVFCFDALGNHALLKVLAHINDGADDWRVIGICGNPVDKGLVNFQDTNGKLLKIAEAGVAGAEVIHHKAHTYILSWRSTVVVDSACSIRTPSVSSRST